MSKRSISVSLIMILVILGLALIGFVTRSPEKSGIKNFSVEVVHSDYSTRTIACMSDVDYLGDVLLSKGVVEGYEGPYGIYIEVVDGEAAIYEETGAYWAFYINDEYATTGIDKTLIEDGATYKFVYTKE
ncbi:MAG: DUF4430 domain-containing protein [Oscillospiraceae bacterium]|nr:DUF4430 domain-containing protein [Oscillospiraceae bacterium]